MAETTATLPVHSLFEATCFLMVTRCRACDSALATDEAALTTQGNEALLTVPCRAGGHVMNYQLLNVGSLQGDANSLPAIDTATPISTTDEPSEILDVWEWITLYSVMIAQASTLEMQAKLPVERAAVRRLQTTAAMCVNEALKFYESDNELPPSDAMLHDRSREMLKQRPELFARQRLLEQRSALPPIPRQ